MKALINYFFNLCLLRAKPQDLPASQALLVVISIFNILVGLLLIGDMRPRFTLALFESLFDTMLMLGVLWLMLTLRNLQARFLQTATALVGSGLLLGLIALPLFVLSGSGQTESDPSLVSLLLFALVMWSMVVLGHILRHTFNLPMPLAIGFGLLYTFFSYAVMANIFQVS